MASGLWPVTYGSRIPPSIVASRDALAADKPVKDLFPPSMNVRLTNFSLVRCCQHLLANINLSAGGDNALLQWLQPLVVAGVIGVLCAPLDATAETPPESAQRLKFGIAPYSASSRLIPSWAPLVRYLEAELEQPIATVSAPNHQQFLRRAKRGEYFFYVSTPHSAVAAISRGEALPVRYLTVPFRSQLVVHNHSYIKGLSDLRNRIIVTASPDSFVAANLDYEINQLQILGPFSTTVRYEKTHAAALRSLHTGLADAAYITRLPHNDPAQHDTLAVKTVQQSALVGYPFLLVPADSGEESAARLGVLLDNFEAKSLQAEITLKPVVGEPRYRFARISAKQLRQFSALAEHWQPSTPAEQPF